VNCGAGKFELGSNEVHVWSFPLRLAAAEESMQGRGLLSADELGRAAAFHFERDRLDFIGAHVRLRELLGACLDVPAKSLRFMTGAQGKPRLEDVSHPQLGFNLSHSHGRGLVAIARGCEIGVDLEQIRADVDFERIVASHFSPAERTAWAALPEAGRREGFFHGWARKEAYVKALGAGFSREPASYTVDLEPGGAGDLLADSVVPDAPRNWTVRGIPAPPGFAAALAYSGPPRAVRMHE
jgi:4'-phosphopantetheinyl transferase